ncbi:uncharacterized protein C2orf78 homolog [Phodopus roborovskii]|uniref:uncharacterized protein C2orf78 homolog n=1 Tax=Phodopus roborovskii TaxID=109678 RepID=UPI0021E3738B|nr:uncharacterized protein C2orf78 homolog [Phodopus roborovskii]
MSENLQSTPFFGTECALRPSVPVLRNATPSAGSACNFSGVSTPAVSSAWLQPSDSSTCCQQLMDGAYFYQRAGTTMLTALTDQSQISTSALSYPDALQWDLTGSTDRKVFTETIIHQNTTLSSLSMTAQCEPMLHLHALVSSCPTVSATFLQATQTQVPNEGNYLAPSYQEGSQDYYYDQSRQGPLLAGEIQQCLQAYGSISYSGSQASALHPEMMMVFKEIQPTNVQTPFSTSAIYYPSSVQARPDTSLQGSDFFLHSFSVVEMQTSLGLTPSGQTLCLLQSPDLCKACPQDVQMKTPPVSGDSSLAARIHSPSQFLTLPPAPSLEQKENNGMEEMTAEPSTPMKAYECITEKQDAQHFPLTHPGLQQPLTYTDDGSLRQKAVSDNSNLGSTSLAREEPGALHRVMESSIDLEGMTTLVSDIPLPQLLNPLTDLVQLEHPTATQSQDFRVFSRDQFQENSTGSSTDKGEHKKDQKSSNHLHGSPQARIQCQVLLEGEEGVGIATASAMGIDHLAKHLDGTAHKSAQSRASTSRAQGQDKIKRTRGNKTKKTGELKPSCPRAKVEDNLSIPKTRRKRHPSVLSQDSFKKPRTHLGMHMLEAVQVFHPLGKKSEKKIGISSSQAVLNSSSNKDPRTGRATTSRLDEPHDGRGPAPTLGNAQRPESNAHKECPSPSLYELPPPGKVKLVPLPFQNLDKPQARPLSRKLLSLASGRPTAAYPVRPHPHSAQSTTFKPFQPAPASTSLMASDKTAVAAATSTTPLNITNHIHSCTRPAVTGPAPYRASSHTSLPREHVSAARNKAPSPPKPQTQYLLQDFSRQPIPWRKVDLPGPDISQPITAEQRPEREAMKRWAQQERQSAAKGTSQDKLHVFLHRDKDMEIDRYYGYAM